MSDVITESQLYDVLLALLNKRPDFRHKLGDALLDQVAREVDADNQLARAKGPKKVAAKVHTSPPMALFAKVRRLVIMASKPNIKDSDLEKQLEEEWERMGPSEKAKWQDLADAGNSTTD